jgi:hypothetical protein
MKMIVVGVLLAALPHWAASTFAKPVEGDCKKVEVHVAYAAEDGELVTVVGDADAAKCAAVNAYVLAAAGDEGAGDQVKTIKIVRGGESGDAESRGWLGVAIGDVPEALADQLDTEGRGVMILNVVKDSPAEQAGLQAHDVIMSFNGEDVGQDVAKVVELVGSHVPGDVVSVVVLRQGDEKALEVKLGSRGDMKAFKWIMKTDPLAEIEEKVSTRCKILRRGDDNEWVIEDLGDLGKIVDLSDDVIKAFIPKGHSKSTQIFVDGNRKSVKTKVETDGTVIVIEQEDDGEITVTRINKGGEETTETYATEEELAEVDPEAYELYQEAGESAVIHLDLEGLEGLADIHVDLDEIKEHATEWQGELQEHLHGAGEAYAEAMEEAREHWLEAMEEWREQAEDGRSESLPPFVFKPGMDPKDFGPDLFTRGFPHLGKPRHSFTTHEDGRIEVRIRKGDSELVQLFEGEDDLAERKPKLYKKYQELVELDEE